MIPVKLPKEVLSLFPTWEYRCPRCSTYVESNISFCPNCKMPFDKKKWRVPPRFFKSHEAMSEYAHNVLAPKLSPEQRKLLFKYFTELFSDGFESGNFDAWSNTGTGGGATIDVEDVHPHHETYNAIYGSLIDANDFAIAVKTLVSEQSEIYMRAYLQFATVPQSTTIQDIGCSFANVTSAGILWSGLQKVGADVYWGVEAVVGGTWTSYLEAVASNPVADTWYCVEIYLKVDGAAGIVKLWVDGSLKVEQTDLDTDNRGNVKDIKLGAYLNATEGASITMYSDCVVVADTYIGPETTEQTYTKTWTTDSLFKKLAIPKALSVDTAFQKQDIPKTFGLDATFQKSFIIQKQIDALFKRFDILKSFAVDARFGALMTQTISRQIDILLKKLDLTKNFGLDVYFGPFEAETYAKTFALDAIFAYKVRLPELWLDENGKIVLNISKPYTWVGT
jgi:hypothetical protein